MGAGDGIKGFRNNGGRKGWFGVSGFSKQGFDPKEHSGYFILQLLGTSFKLARSGVKGNE